MNRNSRTGIPALPKCYFEIRAKKPPDRISTPHPYPCDPVTIGDHLRKHRLDLGLFRREVAIRLGTTVDSIRKWENNWSSPSLSELPSIIEFIGYCPYDVRLAFGEKVVLWRCCNGMTQEETARLAGIDPSTLSSIERGRIRDKSKRHIYLGRILSSLSEHLKEQSSCRSIGFPISFS
jgi:transcriptional regulator with XRE-family HTH domain